MGVASINLFSLPLMAHSNKALSYPGLINQAWPIILANAAVPLLGLVDTAIIGNTGSAQQLGAIALGALIFNFVYWSFGFLRMSTTGFIAQAAGAKNPTEIRNILGRSLVIGLSISLILLMFKKPIGFAAFYFFQASTDVEQLTAEYFSIRLWGAPASLATFVLIGALIGLGKSKLLLGVQLLLNGLNIILDIVFAGVLGWGVKGIAIGTLIAEWTTCLFGLFLVLHHVKGQWHKSGPFWRWPDILKREAVVKTLNANTDILIRTLLLVFSFAWFTNKSAQFGDDTLASNHILLQFISFSAFFLDGFAFVAESIVGKSIGAKNTALFKEAVYRTSVIAFLTALVLTSLFYFLGSLFIGELTNIGAVNSIASQYLWLASIYILFSIAAFQLDGIFIGAVRSREMRNAALVSTGVFLVICELLIQLGNVGLWLSFVVYVIARAVALFYYYPRVVQTLK